ncbi:amidohydrolase [Ferrimicrobium sp.]|uniref:amidohydrolase n=1 Tax=Ferrimicrobium sp. TaxID=2926050 RepID=UPI00263575DA|nr:amidohydrolase [Ferrimicrobium sp.]
MTEQLHGTEVYNATIWLGPGKWLHEASLVFSEDGVIRAIGDAHGEHRCSQRIDANGRTLLPAFGEGHAHPQHAGLREQFAPVAMARNIEEILRNLGEYAHHHPEQEWIQGWGYDPSLAPNGQFDARWIDTIIADRPVMLRATDYHTVWCNTRALELGGVDRVTEQPQDGEIVRRQDGSPLGTLREWGATRYILDIVPLPTLTQRTDALAWASAQFLEGGITWVQDAWVEGDELAAYLALANGGLTVRYNLGLRADPKRYREQVGEFRNVHDQIEQLNDPFLTARTVKIFADGVLEAGTAAVLEPYHDCPHSQGIPNWSPEELTDAVVRFDQAGLQVHIHAIGDRAIRMALDAIETAQRSNPTWDRRPTIAHSQLIDPIDLDRFGSLGVIANFEPLWAQLDPLQTELTFPRIGDERANRQYPIASLLRRGAHLSFGSDWPVSDFHPLAGIGVAVTRQNSDGEPAMGWQPDERLSLDEALSTYTVGTAYQAFADQTRGTIAVGQIADLVLLDSDLSDIDPSQLGAVRVMKTFLGGREVFSRE